MDSQEFQDPKNAPFAQFGYSATPDELKGLAYKLDLAYPSCTQLYVVFNAFLIRFLLY